MDRNEQAKIIIQEDVRLIDDTAKFAGKTFEFFEDHPATTFIGALAQGLGAIAVCGLVGGTVGLAFTDLRAIVNGDQLRRPFGQISQIGSPVLKTISTTMPNIRWQTIRRTARKPNAGVARVRKIAKKNIARSTVAV